MSNKKSYLIILILTLSNTAYAKAGNTVELKTNKYCGIKVHSPADFCKKQDEKLKRFVTKAVKQEKLVLVGQSNYPKTNKLLSPVLNIFKTTWGGIGINSHGLFGSIFF